jgi:hypothetical protein
LNQSAALAACPEAKAVHIATVSIAVQLAASGLAPSVVTDTETGVVWWELKPMDILKRMPLFPAKSKQAMNLRLRQCSKLGLLIVHPNAMHLQRSLYRPGPKLAQALGLEDSETQLSGEDEFASIIDPNFKPKPKKEVKSSKLPVPFPVKPWGPPPINDLNGIPPVTSSDDSACWVMLRKYAGPKNAGFLEEWIRDGYPLPFGELFARCWIDVLAYKKRNKHSMKSTGLWNSTFKKLQIADEINVVAHIRDNMEHGYTGLWFIETLQKIKYATPGSKTTPTIKRSGTGNTDERRGY